MKLIGKGSMIDVDEGAIDLWHQSQCSDFSVHPCYVAMNALLLGICQYIVVDGMHGLSKSDQHVRVGLSTSKP